MSTALAVPTEIYHGPMSFADKKAMADAVAKSGLYRMTSEQVLTLMMLCEAQGLHPGNAVMRYHVYQGTVSMRADAMLAAFQKAGGCFEWTKDTLTECEAVLSHPIHYPKPKTVSFTLEDAKRAKLANKDNWVNHPRQMLRARVITNGIRQVLPGVILGIYTPDEVEEFAPVPREVRPLPVPPVKVMDFVEAAPVAPRAEPAPPREPTSEWGKWITEAVTDFNRELAMIADQQPENLKLRQPLRPQAVANAVINAGIEADFLIEDALLNEKGKRDPAKVRKTLDMLWSDDPEWIIETAGKYLADKMVELLPHPEPEPAIA